MTVGCPRDIIDTTMLTLQTHVALTYLREQDHQPPASHQHAAPQSDRYDGETAASVGSLRRRLAQMHLAPAAQG